MAERFHLKSVVVKGGEKMFVGLYGVWTACRCSNRTMCQNLKRKLIHHIVFPKKTGTK